MKVEAIVQGPSGGKRAARLGRGGAGERWPVEFEGIYAPVVTPFKGDYGLDADGWI